MQVDRAVLSRGTARGREILNLDIVTEVTAEASQTVEVEVVRCISVWLEI